MQKIKLSIPEPCHENWNRMTPTQQGRFCNACAKQVVDFSAMSDAEVLNYFSGIKNEKVCGRAYPDQLDRMITMPVYPKKKWLGYWNYITMLFLFFSKTTTTKAQGGIKVVSLAQVKTNSPVNVVQSLQGKVGEVVIDNNSIIKGRVIDTDGQPIAGAGITKKGTNQGVLSDSYGNYKISVNKVSDILQINAVGFQKLEIHSKNLNENDIMLTKMEQLLLGDVVVVGRMISSDGYYLPYVTPVHTVKLQVLDNENLLPVTKASIIITNKRSGKSDELLTGKNGIYKLRKIKEDEVYIVKIIADGFLDEEIILNGKQLIEKRENKQVFLERIPSLTDFKKLDNVVVSSTQCTTKKEYSTGTVSIKGQMTSGIIINRTITDSIKLITTKIAGSLKIYPNPVLKGNDINLNIKIKHTGPCNIQIVDASGKVVLQKQINAVSKSLIEIIHTNNNWAAGIYFVRVSSADNKLVSTSSFSIK